MKCQEVLKHLSLLLDDMLERDIAEKAQEHLESCHKCNREYNRFARLREELSSMDRASAPEYLRHLVQMRLDEARHENLATWLREGLEYYWSKIRTTERIWYLTRITGAAATILFFLALSSAVRPIYLDLRASGIEHEGPSQYLKQQLGIQVLKSLGLMPVEAQRKPISSSEPQINEIYLLKFGESASRTGSDDSFSVFTTVDRSGSAKIQNVLEYPADRRLLQNFNSMLTSAQLRPASQNGRAVDSHLVLTFNKIFVYD
jgi:hypothetical protein